MTEFKAGDRVEIIGAPSGVVGFQKGQRGFVTGKNQYLLVYVQLDGQEQSALLLAHRLRKLTVLDQMAEL